jgi:hypothetical protein
MGKRCEERGFSRVGRAIESNDLVFLQGWLLGSFEVLVSEVQMAQWITKPSDFSLWDWWDNSWRAWFKRRLQDAGYLQPGGKEPPPIRCGCELHIGFIGIEESPEMLERLRREPGPVPETIATPGMTRTNQKLQPIDRVAARVTDWVEKTDSTEPDM